jgi:hypothetical protein
MKVGILGGREKSLRLSSSESLDAKLGTWGVEAHF